jgi:hypothetical protein
MRVSVGLFLVLGLMTAACGKKEPDSQAIGSDNGVALGEGTPQNAAVPTPGAVTPTKVTQPTQLARPAFGPIGGTPVGATPGTPAQPAQPAAVQGAPPAAPVTKTPSTPAAPVAAAPPAANPAVAGRGVPPPPGGRPKPGTK